MIIYDKVLNPRVYVEIITGSYYILNADDQYAEAKLVLKQNGFDKLCDYPMAEVGKLNDADKKFVLIDFVNLTEDNKMDYQYRWCELPECITRERILETLE